ncbi:integrase catalytic domain-containing protein [Trichonephila clavipes]|nr:integrase catalytic domain-containing protein [Trichonephila clavipes]
MKGDVVVDGFETITLFRRHKFAFTADIQKMYRQILLGPDQRDLQRIVWKVEPDAEILTYRLKTVTYGMSNAPFLAIRTLQQLAQDEKFRFPLASEALLYDTYMDDITSGAADLETARQLQSKLRYTLKSCVMKHHKCTSNSPELLNSSLSSDVEHSFSVEPDASVKTLGISWRPFQNCFVFWVSILISGPLYALQLEQAENRLIRMVQAEIFSAEIRALQSQKDVLSNSKLKALNPFLDDGVLRVGGRLSNSDLPSSAKYPAVLPNNHGLTHRIIAHIHKQNFRIGASSLLHCGRQIFCAIDAEIVSDLTSEAFNAALKRFFGRRVKCANLYSGNGKHFEGANKEIKRLLKWIKMPDEINFHVFYRLRELNGKSLSPVRPSKLTPATYHALHRRELQSPNGRNYQDIPQDKIPPNGRLFKILHIQRRRTTLSSPTS